MGNPSQKFCLALDANPLIDLARGEDEATDFFSLLWRRKIPLTMTSTPLGELAAVAIAGPDTASRKAAGEALRRLGEWGVTGYELTSAQHKAADEFSRQLREAHELPPRERNDGRLPAEAGMAGCLFLASEDKHLLAIEEADWRRHFRRAGLPFVNVLSPRAFLRRLR